MSRSSRRMVVVALQAALGLAACSTAARASAPGHGTPPADTTSKRYTDADIRFMQRMMGHHAQALAMTALVPARTRRDDLRLLAQRIEISQRDEIALMRRWLEARHATVPGAGAQHDASGHDMSAHDAHMPGMLGVEELARLANARDGTFDRLFLESMIRHHEGALVMVSELLGAQGAGQEPEIFRLVSDIDADQRAEIRRMRAMLGKPPVKQ